MAAEVGSTRRGPTHATFDELLSGSALVASSAVIEGSKLTAATPDGARSSS